MFPFKELDYQDLELVDRYLAVRNMASTREEIAHACQAARTKAETLLQKSMDPPSHSSWCFRKQHLKPVDLGLETLEETKIIERELDQYRKKTHNRNNKTKEPSSPKQANESHGHSAPVRANECSSPRSTQSREPKRRQSKPSTGLPSRGERRLSLTSKTSYKDLLREYKDLKEALQREPGHRVLKQYFERQYT